MDRPKSMAVWGRAKARERYRMGGAAPYEDVPQYDPGAEMGLVDELRAAREKDIADRNKDAERQGRKPPGRPEEYELKPELDRELDSQPDDLKPKSWGI